MGVSLQPGRHDIKVSRDGFQPFIWQVTVKSGENEIIQVQLQR